MHLKMLQKIFNSVDTLLDDPDFIQNNKINGKSFTRKRVLDFKTIFYGLCSSQKRSLQTEVSSFIMRSEGKVASFSPQAFSKARYKIKPDAFYKVFRMAAKLSCARKRLQTLWGYRIFAVDGTTFILPDTKENRETFGVGGNESKTYALASASILYDVLNDTVVDGCMGRYNTSERKDCYEMLARTDNEFTSTKKLLLLDRGYPSREMYHFLQERGFKYLIRERNAYCTPTAIRDTVSQDCIVTDAKDKSLVHRVIKIHLSSGETEILVTNIFDESINVDDFYHLYHLRWGIETKYLNIKHKHMMEKFTGYHPTAIRQDFYVLLFLSNLSSLLQHASEEIRMKKENTKWNYQIAITAVINMLTENITQLFYNHTSRAKRLLSLAEILKNKRSAIRPDRHAERKRPRVVKRYNMNHK